MAKEESKLADPGMGLEWPSEPGGYALEQLIGEGAFAKVYRAKCASLGQTVAVKVINLDRVQTSLEDVYKEVAIMKSCNHRNVLACYNSFVNNEDSSLWVVMPFLDKGSCFRILTRLRNDGVLRDGQGLAEEFVACIMKEVLHGLEYFHAQLQVHRDIKAGNILVNSDGSVKLADFGVSGLVQEAGDRRDKRHTFVGTPCWMAPEVMEQVNGYDQRADIWSFGITLLELAKGFAPYAKRPPMKVLLMTLQEPPPSLKTYGGNVSSFSRGFKEVYQMCLQKDPKLRPTAKKLLSLKFFRNAPPVSEMVRRFMHHIPDVEAVADGPIERLPGMAPVVRDEEVVSDPASGTTWVFPESMAGPKKPEPAPGVFEAELDNEMFVGVAGEGTEGTAAGSADDHEPMEGSAEGGFDEALIGGGDGAGAAEGGSGGGTPPAAAAAESGSATAPAAPAAESSVEPAATTDVSA